MNGKRAAFGLALFLCLGFLWSFTADGETHYVDSVIDGDTVRLENGESVRLIGINAPELSHEHRPAEAYAKTAKSALTQLVDQRAVNLVPGREKRDRYGRLLCYLELPNGTDIQARMLEKGMAVAIAIPPETSRIETYSKLEQDARDAHKGLWGTESGFRKQADHIGEKDISRFRLVRGTVSGVKQSRKNIYFKLTPALEVKIARNLWKRSWPAIKPESLIGETIEARGWLNRFEQWLQITIKHPAMLDIKGRA